MIDRILISVIIPSYNRANTVGETIESIVNQQVNADIEIVIGDDCSTDNAREVLLQYKEKYPNIQLKIHNSTTPSMLEALRNNNLDCAVLVFPLSYSEDGFEIQMILGDKL